MAESRQEQIARWEREGWLDPECRACREDFYDSPRMPADVFATRHKPSDACRSGKAPHCTCDEACW